MSIGIFKWNWKIRVRVSGKEMVFEVLGMAHITWEETVRMGKNSSLRLCS